MKKIVLFASGSGSNVENIVKYFKENGKVEISKVYTNNPNAYVIERCKQQGVPYMVFGRKEFAQNLLVLEDLRAINPDLIVLAGFLWLVPGAYVNAFPDKIINIHPALLPKYGGKGMYGQRVHEAVVANGESESGITIHYVNEKYDEGNIICQAKCKVLAGDTSDEVASKVHQLEYDYFPKTIEKLLL
ncbi:phosphoribosylglycinamide formyltransferase [Carboxylicivirga sediminis]|uniref:Phosphoribosylglycinamide formyltransferase n=1 Tax=Carboxylicivirga sediminis TaxID=2006564 RepID=A0A941F7A6_9BACT|nr:phosphoribosylglycinamide formyltransferase [Carboxylicivirga sediminis]MBR8537922.1 phosphoribosylglycinamide formyltransferase [Carboxylicivirga sediminis]